jgi:hypothetical protein
MANSMGKVLHWPFSIEELNKEDACVAYGSVGEP